LLEAGALGKAVVATSVCGVPELIRDDDTGIVVDNEDESALAAALLRMLNNEPLRAACGQRLRRLVLERFTLEATCRAYLRLVGADAR
jgi:glycosyltransferase involved in cell wall biosynthesis